MEIKWRGKGKGKKKRIRRFREKGRKMRTDNSAKKYGNLEKILKGMGKVLIAYSGGVDSTFLLKAASEALGRENVLAVTATSSTYPKRELDEAKRLAEKMGVKHEIIVSEETDIREFVKNPVNRCYYCKRELFSKLREIADRNGIRYVLDASNCDDAKDEFRHGRKAARELGVRSPLKEAEMTKEEIREVSKMMNLETWNKPSFACLASRFPYGQKITRNKLGAVDKAENALRKMGFGQLRVRHHGKIARIEIGKKDFGKAVENAEGISKELKKAGFDYVTMDLQGYRSGSMNEPVKKAGERK